MNISSNQSIIDADLLKAYLETVYQVGRPCRFVLQIGQVSHKLELEQQKHHTDCSAFISACNPFSQLLDAASNAQRHGELGAELERLGLGFIEGIGQHPVNDWPGEASYLVFGLKLEQAIALGNRYQQNAIVWSDASACPRLWLLR